MSLSCLVHIYVASRELSHHRLALDSWGLCKLRPPEFVVRYKMLFQAFLFGS